MIIKLYLYLGGAWVDTTSDVRVSDGISSDVGMSSNRETDRIAKTGTLNFTLDNNAGEYTPEGVSAHADWGKGTPVKVEFTRGDVTKVKFIGRVNSIRLGYALNNNTAQITALDWMYFASQMPLDFPSLQTNYTADDVINTIIGISPIQPTATDLQAGTVTFPYAFHDNTIETNAYSEISKATFSEWGYSYVKQDGTLVFEANGGRETVQKTITEIIEDSGFLLQSGGSFILQSNGDKIIFVENSTNVSDATATDIQASEFEYGERITNRVNLKVYPYALKTEPQLVYQSEIPQRIPAGETVKFRVQFRDQSSLDPIAAITPIVKQYTILHFDNPEDEGITDIIDSAEPISAGNRTAFSFGSGAAYYTNVKRFGNSSVGFNGSSDYVQGSSQEKFNLRDEDFTIDWWEYRLASTSGRAAISRDTAGGYSPFVCGYSDGTNNNFYATSNGSSWDLANAKSMGSLSIGAWAHYAVTRQGDTWRTFKNGTKISEWTASGSILVSTAAMSIFKYGSAYTNGYIDELRIIKGYAEYTADFTAPTKQHEIDGINWSVFEYPNKSGNELTKDVTLNITTGGVGTTFEFTSASATDGYVNLDVYAIGLQSLSPISYTPQDDTSVNAHGYFGENIDMRLRQDIQPAQAIADDIITAEKNPRFVLNRVDMVTKNQINEQLFLLCDVGDLVEIDEALSGYNALNHIQGIAWSAVNRADGVNVNYSWILKES